MIRYALIGAGMMGQEQRDQACQLSGDHCRGFSSYIDLIKSEPFDALIIASPNHTHFQILKDLAATSVPILVEKPLCLSKTQCDNVIQLLSNRPAPVWVAMEYRYKPPVAQLIDHVRAGEAGTPIMIGIQEHRYPFLGKVNDWNRFNRNTGGTLVEKCCHFFDLFALIAQSTPKRVYATASMDVNHLDERYDGEQPDILDNAFVAIDFANGIRAMLDLCMFADGVVWQEKIRVTGDRGGIEVELPGPPPFAPNSEGKEALLSVFPRRSPATERQTVSVPQQLLDAGHHHGATFFQHQKFQQIILEGGIPEVTLNDGALAVAIGEAAQQSAASGQSILFE